MEEFRVRAIVIAGVSGSGKTTVGRALARSLGWQFKDADELHSKKNLRKMALGYPLTEVDRLPWLERVRAWMDRARRQRSATVMACSALRKSYADFLLENRPFIRLAVLRVEPELLAQRLAARRDHFFPPKLLASQLSIQELPAPEQVFDGSMPAPEIVREIIQRFRLKK